MKRLFITLLTFLLFTQQSFAFSISSIFNSKFYTSDERAVSKLLHSQARYANKNDYNRFISTFDAKYTNSDGFNLDTYSLLIKEIWDTYKNIKYNIKIKELSVDNNKATVKLKETSYADIALSKAYNGVLNSEADTIYYLEKDSTGKWKVISDTVTEETTTMLYGDAKGLDIKLTAPNNIKANTDYTATLEFEPPKDTIAIASIASDIVQYPQPQTKEVFRPMPEDNILERIFTSNSENKNEYIVASIGLTKTSINDLNLRLSLVGFGYKIKRVNVISNKNKEVELNNVKN